MFKNIKKRKISEFIKTDLTQYFLGTNLRSIPHVSDGLKPSQRKIIFTIFKNKIKDEKKVNQLAGLVSDQSAYHHGEASLEKTIIWMAQDFVGTNNINLLYPEGQFGTRYDNEAYAQTRYIKTKIMDVVRHIFREEDDEILNYLEDDGKSIEPEYYMPIIPMILVNGASGIGSGWSTSIPQYHPLKITEALIRYLKGTNVRFDRIPLHYKGFTGEIKNGIKPGSYETFGKYYIKSKKIYIEELPVGLWTENFKSHLDKLEEEKVIKKYENQSDTNVVKFIITPSPELDLNDGEYIIKTFLLKGKISTSNTHLFSDRKIRRYDSVSDIFDDYIKLRIEGYEKRKKVVLARLNADMIKIKNIVKFIEEIQKDIIEIKNTKLSVLENTLDQRKYDKINDGYSYLTRLSIHSLTYEKSRELKEEAKHKKQLHDSLKKKDIKEMWIDELNQLKMKLKHFA